MRPRAALQQRAGLSLRGNRSATTSQLRRSLFAIQDVRARVRGPDRGASAGCRRRRIRAKIRAGFGARPNRQPATLQTGGPCAHAKGSNSDTMLATKRSAVNLLVVGLLLCGGLATPLLAQAPGSPAAGADPAEPQQIPRRVAIRFLTDSDYPPFNYYDEDNILTGFNVDIARAVCLELAAACDIQVRP